MRGWKAPSAYPRAKGARDKVRRRVGHPWDHPVEGIDSVVGWESGTPDRRSDQDGGLDLMNQLTRDSDRRNSSRRQPKTTAKITCRAGTLGLGPNVAVSFLHISQSGIRSLVKTPRTPAGHFEIALTPLRP